MSIRDEISRIEQAKSDIKSAIIEKGVEVPDSTKINEYAEQISKIPTGTNVQRYEGTFTTDESGNATVDCGFQPDVVTVPVGLLTSNNGQLEQIVSIDFSSVTTDAENKSCCCWAPDDTGLLVFVIKRKQIGFEISCATYDWSLKISVIPNRSFDFVAIKFTQ